MAVFYGVQLDKFLDRESLVIRTSGDVATKALE